MIPLDTEQHMEGRQYVKTERRQLSTSQEEQPKIDTSLTDLRKNQSCGCLDLGHLES